MNNRDGGAASSAGLHTRLVMIAIGFVATLVVCWLSLPEPGRSLALVVISIGLGAALATWRPKTSWARTKEQSVSVDRPPRPVGALSLPDLPKALTDPAIVLDGASVVVAFNAGAQALFDRLREGVPLEHVLRDPELIDAAARALSHSERSNAGMVRRGERRLTATVAPLGVSGEGTPPRAVLITIHDQSEQHRLLEMRSDFIANASHELRTPLASVRGFIETLQGSARNDPVARERFLSIMAEQAERMTRLIDDLLLLSRVEEKVNLKPTGTVEIRELIADVVRSLETQALERNFAITLEPGESLSLSPADRDELFQAFHNIIENAVKYGHDGGSAAIRIARAGGKARIEIADDGPGISPEHLPRLTERFYRVNSEHSRRIGGTGLGLAIAKHVINRHGGELNIQSVVGLGTAFEIVLPGAAPSP